MIYTKEQAKGVWCPLGFRPVQVNQEGKEPEIHVANRGPDNSPMCACIADRCPLFEWADKVASPNQRGGCALKKGAQVFLGQQAPLHLPGMRSN